MVIAGLKWLKEVDWRTHRQEDRPQCLCSSRFRSSPLRGTFVSGNVCGTGAIQTEPGTDPIRNRSGTATEPEPTEVRHRSGRCKPGGVIKCSVQIRGEYCDRPSPRRAPGQNAGFQEETGQACTARCWRRRRFLPFRLARYLNSPGGVNLTAVRNELNWRSRERRRRRRRPKPSQRTAVEWNLANGFPVAGYGRLPAFLASAASSDVKMCWMQNLGPPAEALVVEAPAFSTGQLRRPRPPRSLPSRSKLANPVAVVAAGCRTGSLHHCELPG